MKIKVIGDEFSSLGFALSGIESVTVDNKDAAEEEFDKALGDKEIGVILITEKEADLIRDKVNRRKVEGEMPLVVEIPSRSGWQGKNKALELIKRVLSVSV
jgi:V/A-type H+-transporting ATPase subunit F